MQRLNVLGANSVEASGGPIQGRGAQRRRIALLAVLALARRPVSRDRLIGLLWPETSAERARKLLSESLYVLRKALGEEALGGSGDDVFLDLQRVHCDAVEFEDCVQSGRLEEAVALYQGPLLDGFFLDDASEFEHWVDGERARLARLHTDALLRLAQHADEGGERQSAVHCWRQLCLADPYNETYALRLMLALEAAGDRAGALSHARVHTALMKEEFGAEPDADIEALAARLRQPEKPARAATGATAAALPEIASHPPVSEATLAPGTEPPRLPLPQGVEVPAAPAGTPRLRNVLAGSLVLLVVVAGWLLWRAQGRYAVDAAAAPELRTVMVVPFTVEGSPELHYLGNGAATLLSTALDGAGRLRSIDNHTVLRTLHGPLTLAQAGRTAERVGAEWFVLGSIVQVGNEVQLTADLHGGDGSVLHSAAARGAIDAMGAHFDALAREFISYANGGSDVRRQVIETMPLAGIKDYLEGDSAFRAGRYGEAVVALQKAVRHHPDNALAHYLLSMAAEWNFDFTLARTAAADAIERSDRLEGRYAELVRAWNDFLAGRAGEAERRYQALVTRNPDDIEARAGLGEVLAHFNPVRGRPSADAIPAFERVLAADPAYGEVRFHLLENAAAQRDTATFNRLLAGLDPGAPQTVAWQAISTMLTGSAAETDRTLRSLASADELAIGITAGRLAANAQDLASARRVAVLLTTERRVGDWRAAGEVFNAHLDMADGNTAAAIQRLQRAAAVDEGWSLEMQALALLHPLAHPSSEELQALRSRLELWNPAARTPSSSFFFLAHIDVHPQLQAYLLSLLSARLGDAPGAVRWHEELQRRETRANAAFLYSLSTSSRARIALLRADTTAAIDLLRFGAGAEQGEPERLATSPFFSHALDRFLLAELLDSQGQHEEARRWYRSLTEGFDFSFAPAARARLR
ncbi:MAG TPA: BTAD domain-containing putative transcriptional regulator [Longimicrobiales bacterium]|nr:BTAD domain-containing putative transcriptional regulator [Longimicrobiales bacterium]